MQSSVCILYIIQFIPSLAFGMIMQCKKKPSKTPDLFAFVRREERERENIKSESGLTKKV